MLVGFILLIKILFDNKHLLKHLAASKNKNLNNFNDKKSMERI